MTPETLESIKGAYLIKTYKEVDYDGEKIKRAGTNSGGIMVLTPSEFKAAKGKDGMFAHLGITDHEVLHDPTKKEEKKPSGKGKKADDQPDDDSSDESEDQGDEQVEA